MSRGAFKEAKALADKAGELAPEAAVPLALTGVALAKLGDSSGAKAAILKARALDPSDTQVSQLLRLFGAE